MKILMTVLTLGAALMVRGALHELPAAEREQMNHFDLTTVYGFRGGIPGTAEGVKPCRSFTWMADVSLDHWRQLKKNGTLPFWPSLSTGYDDRPWRGERVLEIYDYTADNFRRICRDARTFADESGVTTFLAGPLDEWGEGSIGTIVLESDLDLSPEVAYRAYEERWQIELVMRYYKSACEFDEARVHSDYSVIGSEFCDFLATVLTWRLIKEFTKAGLLDETTYRRIMKNLKRAKKAKVGEEDWQLIKVNPSIERMLASLCLLQSATAGIDTEG